MGAHVLAGVTVPLTTPINDFGVADAAAVARHLESLALAGVDSLMLLGSNGEGALLPPDLTSAFLIEATAAWRALRPAGTVIVNVSAPGTTEMLRRAEAALACEPDALVVTPPGYFRHRPDEIESHLRTIEQFARAWAVYNIPRYACPLPPAVLAALLDAEHLIGLKDSSGDPSLLADFLGVLSQRDDLALSQGDERNLLGGIEAGAKGIVPGIANIAPGLVVALFRDTSAGRRAEARNAQEQVTGITGIHGIRPGVPTIKAVLHDRGILPDPRCAPPLIGVTPSELAAIREHLAPYEPQLIGKLGPAFDSHQERSA